MTFLEKGIMAYVDDEQLDKISHMKGYMSLEAYPDEYKKIAVENEKGRFLYFRLIYKKD